MVGTCYAGPIEGGERALRPLRASGTPPRSGRTDAVPGGFQGAIDSTVVHGWHYYWKSTHLPELRDDLIDVIAEHAFSCSSPRSYVALLHLKGAVSRVAEGATAFGSRQASHAVTLDGVWRPGEDFGERDTDWARRFFAALGRYRKASTLTSSEATKTPIASARRTGPSVYDRLVDVKTTYDPDNVFHHNQNIRPRSERTAASSRLGPASLVPVLQGRPDRSDHRLGVMRRCANVDVIGFSIDQPIHSSSLVTDP